MTPPATSSGADRPGGGATVRALSAPPISLGWLAYRERVAISMWFIPALCVAGALVLSSVGIAIDDHVDINSPLLPGMSAGSAESISSTIASGMLAFTAVVFSTTLVAIQLAGGQYSPRIVRVFVRSRLTHFALGVFLATAVFAINVLAHTRDGVHVHVPVISLTILYVFVFATLVMFIVFANGIVHLMRVQYLLRTVTVTGRAAIEEFLPPERAYRDVPAPVPGPTPTLLRNGDREGLLMSVDIHALTAVAAAHGCWIELLVQPGEYLGFRTPVARVHNDAAGAVDARAVLAHVLVGPERTLVQDPGFALRQLVDVASRALSPAVNDPTTASQVVDHVVDLLMTIATRPDLTGWYADDDDVVRVSMPELGFPRLAELGLTEIAVFGAGSPQVVRRLRAAYDVMEADLGADRAAVIARLRRQLDDATGREMPAAFRQIAARPDRLGMG